MNRYILLFFFLLLVWKGQAQTIDDVPALGEEFKWWLTPEDDFEVYLSTWQYVVPGNGDDVDTFTPPWDEAPYPTLVEIGNRKDYTKEKGWELVEFDFGARAIVSGEQRENVNTGIKHPYFILYNKYRSILRFFFYFSPGSSQAHSGTALEITLPKGIYNFRNNLFYAADHLSTSDLTRENIISVNRNQSSSSWVHFDINVFFDPNIHNRNTYQDYAVDWSFYTIQENEVSLDLEFSTNTLTDIASRFNKADFYTLFSQDEGNSSLKFEETNGDKILDFAKTNIGKYEQIGFKDLASSVNNGAKAASDFFRQVKLSDNSFVFKTLNGLQKGTSKEESLKTETFEWIDGAFKFVEGTTKQGKNGALTNLFKSLDEIGGVASTVVGVFEFVGSTLGWFSDNEEVTSQMSYAESKGTLKGSITAKTRDIGTSLRLPGSFNPKENNSSQQKPYYTCPWGIFTLDKTPIILSGEYDQAYNSHQYSKRYISYGFKSNQNINVLVNEGAQLNIEEVSYALVANVPVISDSEATSELHRSNFYPSNSSHFNPLLIHMDLGTYHIAQFFEEENYKDAATQKTVTNEASMDIRTNFVGKNQMGSLALNLPENASNLRLRVRTVFTTPDGEPVFIIRDFHIREEKQNHSGSQPLFSNHSSGFSYPSTIPDPFGVTIGYNPYKHLSFNSVVEKVLEDPDPYRNAISYRSVHLKPGFHAKPGVTFYTGVIAPYEYTTVPGFMNEIYEPSHYDCLENPYNPNYKSTGIAQAAATGESLEDYYLAYPNPIDQFLNIEVSEGKEQVQKVEVLDTEEQVVVYTYKAINGGESNVLLDLSTLPEDTYYLRIFTKNNLILKRILIQ